MKAVMIYMFCTTWTPSCSRCGMKIPPLVETELVTKICFLYGKCSNH